jgi:hypothetical protein
MRALAAENDLEASGQAPSLKDKRSADLMIRLARVEAWSRWARRACAASIGIAAGVALVLAGLMSVDTEHAPKASNGQMANAQSPSEKSRSESMDRGDQLDSAVASAIPVVGWIHMPPKEASADSRMWWVVLKYGGHP